MTKLGQKLQKFASKQNGGPLKVEFSNLTIFDETCLKLFLMISPSKKSTVMNFKNEALWRYRVTMVQNGGFPDWRQYCQIC